MFEPEAFLGRSEMDALVAYLQVLGETDEEADIGEHLQLKLHAALLAGLTERALARCTIDAGFEVDVAQAAGATLGNQRPGAMLCEVRELFAGFGVRDDSAYRHLEHQVVAALAITVGATPVFALLGAVDTGVPVVNQGVDVFIGLGVDTATASAVVSMPVQITS